VADRLQYKILYSLLIFIPVKAKDDHEFSYIRPHEQDWFRNGRSGTLILKTLIDTILSQFQLPPVLKTHDPSDHLNVILPLPSWYSKWPLIKRFLHLHSVCNFPYSS